MFSTTEICSTRENETEQGNSPSGRTETGSNEPTRDRWNLQRALGKGGAMQRRNSRREEGPSRASGWILSSGNARAPEESPETPRTDREAADFQDTLTLNLRGAFQETRRNPADPKGN